MSNLDPNRPLVITRLASANDLLQEAHDAIIEFLEVDECRCDQMVDADGGDLGPCAKCTCEDLVTRIDMHLNSNAPIK